MKKLAVYTNREEYGLRISEYLREKIDQEYCVISYSREDRLISDVRDSKISVLLTEEDIFKQLCNNKNEEDCDYEEILFEKTDKIICLTDDKSIHDSEGKCICIYRYLPASSLIPEIATFCKIADVETKNVSCINKGEIIAVYSPIGGIGKTTFSIALAKKLSKREKILFLSLEPFSPLTEQLYLDDRYTLSEMMYLFVSQNEELSGQYMNYIQNTEGFNTIAPINSFVELSNIKSSEWIAFLKAISNKGEYEIVIIDFSDAVDDLMSILGICDKVYVPYRDNHMQMKKLDVFKSDLTREFPEKFINEKVEFINIPILHEQEDTYEELDTTYMGRWINTLNV